jgi:hypothetical protein
MFFLSNCNVGVYAQKLGCMRYLPILLTIMVACAGARSAGTLRCSGLVIEREDVDNLPKPLSLRGYVESDSNGHIVLLRIEHPIEPQLRDEIYERCVPSVYGRRLRFVLRLRWEGSH